MRSMRFRCSTSLIATHCSDVLRLAVSIRTGVVSASVMLERLGSYPRANDLALALREIGRVERALHARPYPPRECAQSGRERGRVLEHDLLQHLSPRDGQHINLTGDYLWTDPATAVGNAQAAAVDARGSGPGERLAHICARSMP